MRSDGSLDHEIKTLEQRIRDRRLALQASLHELSDTATVAKQQVRARAASPAVFAGALVLGFLAARIARSMRHKPQRQRVRYEIRREKPVSPARQVLGGVLSLALPIAMKLAQRQAVPLIERVMHMIARRRDYGRYRAQY